MHCNWGDWETDAGFQNVSCTTGAATLLASGSLLTLDGKTTIEVGTKVTYGININAAIELLVARIMDDSDNNELTTGYPNQHSYRYRFPAAASTVYRKTVTLMGEIGGKFQLYIANETGSTITASAWMRSMVIQE